MSDSESSSSVMVAKLAKSRGEGERGVESADMARGRTCEMPRHQPTLGQTWTPPTQKFLLSLFGHKHEEKKLPDLSSDAKPSVMPLHISSLSALPRGMTMEELVSWDVDILTFSSTELMQLAAAVFRESGVLDTFAI